MSAENGNRSEGYFMKSVFISLALLVILLIIGVFYVTFGGYFSLQTKTSPPDSTTYTGQITGDLKYHPAMQGEGIRERNVIVWLPPNYQTDTDSTYSVLYMHDGQNIIDPATSFIGIDWQIDETVDSLIRVGSIDPIIIVGIYNTDDRLYEYTPGEKGDAYMNFVTGTLKTFIDDNYRTKPDRENTYVGGSSAGGIISFMIVWEYSEIFSKAIIMSPAFKSPENFGYKFNYIDIVNQTTDTPDSVYFYIDNGGLDLDAQLQPGIDEMLMALDSKGYLLNRDFVFIKDEQATHNEKAWAARFPNALKTILTSDLN